MKNNSVFVNGVELEEEYLSDEVVTESQVFTNFIVPEGYIFAMGDNREGSTDCRVFGCIPIEQIEGRVAYRIWPLEKIGKIDK